MQKKILLDEFLNQVHNLKLGMRGNNKYEPTQSNWVSSNEAFPRNTHCARIRGWCDIEQH